MGVRVAVDDFGTGYASLSLLKCFPFGSVKIDRTFIRDVTLNPDDAAIVASITAMGHSLRMNVVAEGVETAEQVSFLLRHQIDQMQGPFFGPPRAAEACTEAIRAGPAAVLRGVRGLPGNGHGPGSAGDR
jgi:EAL domain-containing protein (putative c-di-GMP-specific phosphodiesterase class I)